MTRFTSIDEDVWGHRTAPMQPTAVIDRLAKEVREGIDSFEVLTIELEPCHSDDRYERVRVELGVVSFP